MTLVRRGCARAQYSTASTRLPAERFAQGRFRRLSPPGWPVQAIAIAALVVMSPWLSRSACAAERRNDPGSSGTSNRAAREEAIRAIPWRHLDPRDRQAAQFVIKNASMYRRLPTRVIDCDPDLFTFLVRHPEVVIDVWRVMGISQVALTKLADGAYEGTDGAGTTGTVRFLYRNWGQEAHNMALVLAEGAYEGAPFLTKMNAQSVMFVRSSGIQETNGRHYVTVSIDSFVRVEQVGIELMAKTVQPWISKTADRNFIETLSFVSNFSRTAEKNPQGMQRLASRLQTLDEPTRTELVTLCYRTAERYAKLDEATRTGLLGTQLDIAANQP